MLSRGAGGKGAFELPRGAVPLDIWQSWKVVKPGVVGGEGVIKVDNARESLPNPGTALSRYTGGGQAHHIIVQPVEAPQPRRTELKCSRWNKTQR
jgi:hypothetical protein